MSEIVCYDAKTGKGAAPKAFVMHYKNLDRRLRLEFASMQDDDFFSGVFDQERLFKLFDGLYLKRRKMVKDKAGVKLGMEAPERGFQDFVPADEFNPSLHPLGSLMEAARKAASGLTSPPPEGTIDGRMWYTPRIFVIEIPEEKIVIDEDEMDEDIDNIALLAKKPRTLSSLVGKVSGFAKSKEHEQIVFKSFKDKMRVIIQDEAATNLGAGRIVASVIEIVTTKHHTGEPSRSVREKEDWVAYSIRDAIFHRVAMRMAALNWSESSHPTVHVRSLSPNDV